MIDASRIPFFSVLVVALSFGLSGCYTQLASVDHQSERAPASQEVTAEATTEADRYVEREYDDARRVDGYTYRTDEIAYARQAYEARARGDISFAQYRRILVDLHYADPFRFNLHPALFYDPLFSPMIPRARFSASITFGTNIGYSPFLRNYGFSPYYISSVYGHGFYHSIHHHHHYYSPGYYYHHRPRRYVFAHAPYYGYRPYNISRPYAIQRGSTFGARSSTIATGRVGTTGRIVSPGTATDGRVGTRGRVPTTSSGTSGTRQATTSSDSSARQGTVGRTGDSNVRARVPERLEAPERRAPETRGTTRTTQRDRSSRTTRDRGNTRTTRDRGNTRTRSSGNNSSTSSGSRGSSTRSDRGSGSSSRGSSSRRGGNDDS